MRMLEPVAGTTLARRRRVSRPRQWARTVSILWSLGAFLLPLFAEEGRDRLIARGWLKRKAGDGEDRLRKHGA
ncbi:MAG: hypothetical protein IPF53_05235 [Blastocatellia bacterium]|nr:hypothetical protein [Blastocatellia bacterium]